MKKLNYHIFISLFFFGCLKTETPDPIVNEAKPEAFFTVSVNDNGDLTVTNTSKNASSFSWNFGDGSTINTQQTPSYQFEKSGEYTVTLTVTSKGGTATSSQKVKVSIVQKDMVEIDQLLKNLMTKYNIPGAQLAIMKNEKLIYAKGIGLANKEIKEAMNSQHRLRIASTSKAYAGMGIMKLLEKNKVKLQDKVFGPGAILGTKFGKKGYSEQLKSITLSQLLHNTSGAFVDNNGNQVINSKEDLSDKDYLDWVLDNTFIRTVPGTTYYYNNVNYFVASIIIEELSGMKYFDFIKKEILDPIGDTESRLAMNGGKSHEKEVKYYGQGNLVNSIYDFNIERYKGAGAQVSSAISLLKFVAAIDGQNYRPDILPSSLLNTFRTVTPLQTNWAYGLGIWGNRTYAYGSLPSNRSGFMIDPSTGIAVALIFNSHVDYTNASLNNEFTISIQNVLVDIITKNRNYQKVDFF